MRSLLVMVMVGGCSLYGEGDPALDAGVTGDVSLATCASTVLEMCGARPARPTEAGPTSPGPTELEMARWVHDIDLWAVCAESAEPAAR